MILFFKMFRRRRELYEISRNFAWFWEFQDRFTRTIITFFKTFRLRRENAEFREISQIFEWFFDIEVCLTEIEGRFILSPPRISVQELTSER